MTDSDQGQKLKGEIDKKYYELKDEVTGKQTKLEVRQTKFEVEQKAMKEIFAAKLDGIIDTVERSVGTVTCKIDNVNSTMLVHIEDNKTDFDAIYAELKNGDAKFSDLDKKITKLVIIGGLGLVFVGWIAQALITKYFA